MRFFNIFLGFLQCVNVFFFFFIVLVMHQTGRLMFFFFFYIQIFAISLYLPVFFSHFVVLRKSSIREHFFVCL